MSKQKLIDIFNQHSPITEMDEDETLVFMNMILSKDPIFDVDLNDIDKENPIYEQFKPVFDEFVSKVFLKRLEVMTSLKMSLGALIILSFHMPNPAVAIMHCFYLSYKLPANTLVTLKVISEKLFPWGMFSDKQLNDIWDAQKVSSSEFGGTDNMIDYPIVWKNDSN